MKRISYFSYSDPSMLSPNSFTGSIVDINNSIKTNGQERAEFKNARTVNYWAYNVGNLLYNKTLSKVDLLKPSKRHPYYPTESKEVSGTSSYGNLGTITMAQGSGLVSVFSDNTCMLTNASAVSSAVFSFSDVTKLRNAYCYIPNDTTDDCWRKIVNNIWCVDGDGSEMFAIDWANSGILVRPGCAVVLKR